MTISRSAQVDLGSTTYYHVMSRCVRRAFLLGDDPVTGRNTNHRRQWILDRISELSEVFAIRICAYAIMHNHYHLVVHIDEDTARKWSDQEVIYRWQQLFTGQTTLSQDHTETLRLRLFDISWFMRCLNETIARKANKEDECTGRFWEGRFRSQALLDEGALLTCMAYVDLNPIRAGLAQTPEDQEFTSIRQRIEEYRKDENEKTFENNQKENLETHNQDKLSDKPLNSSDFKDKKLPLMNRERLKRNVDIEKGIPHLMKMRHFQTGKQAITLPVSMEEYMALIDWSGRAVVSPNKGSIPENLTSIFFRVKLKPESWTKQIKDFVFSFPTAAGSTEMLEVYGHRTKRAWLKGKNIAKETYLQVA